MGTEAEGKDRTKPKFRLHDMVVESVDLVDRPANQRRFLIVKREDQAMSNQNGTEGLETRPPEASDPSDDVTTVEVDDVEAGTGTSGDSAAEGAADAGTGAKDDKGAAEPVAKDGAKKQDEEEEEDEEAKGKDGDPEGKAKGEDVAKAIPTPVRDAVMKTLREASERLMSVNNALRAANTTTEQMKAPLPDAVFREIKAVQTLVKSILQRYPYPTAEGKTEKAEGDPVDVGLEASVALMKAVGSMTIPAPVRDAVAGSIRSASENLLSIMNAVKGMATTDEQVDAPLPAEMAKAIGEVLTSLDNVVEKYPAPAAKSDAAVAELDKAFDTIRGIIRGCATGEIVVKSETPADDSRFEALVKAAEANTKAINGVIARLDKAEGKPGASNALEDTGEAEPVNKGEGRVSWPSDLAEDIAKRDSDKGKDKSKDQGK